MQFKISHLLVLLGLPLSILSLPRHPTTLPLPNEVVYQFSDPTWVENINVRSNGQLLVTLLGPPSLYAINPDAKHPGAELLYKFPDANGLLGITEVYPDVFTIVVGSFPLQTSQNTHHSYSIWKVDFSRPKNGGPSISKVVDLKEALLLNGMETLPGCPGNVLIADSSLGVVWKLDINTKKYEIAIKIQEAMDPVAGSASPVGINGIHIHEGYLYWTNSIQVTLYRAKITEAGYLAPGAKAEVIVSVPDQIFMDDFTIDKRGTAWVCTNLGNTVLAVGQDGKAEIVVGSITQLTVAGDTSARFGRTSGKFDTLYVSTAGGSALPVNGTVTEGGKVVAIDTRGFRI